jgi:hypothetical protein
MPEGANMKTCYVSTTFGKRPLLLYNKEGAAVREVLFDWDVFYRDAIKPILQASGLDCFRADEVSGTAVINKAQMSAIINSDVMVVDITSFKSEGINANVMYELGMRHASYYGSTIVMRNMRDTGSIPYDLQHIYLLGYEAGYDELTPEEYRNLRNDLGKAVELSLGGALKYHSPLYDLFPELHVDRPQEPCVFIGHGQSKLWARLQVFLENELHLDTVTYEAESRVGESIVPVLDKMLRQATFAVLILTGEDETAEGEKRARQNVIHEAGLFQGVL